MRCSIRSELRMLRELVWHWGIVKKCFFCKKPLLVPVGTEIKFGEFRAPPIKTKLTIHHKDEDHWNNEVSNRKDCHVSCHRSYHMTQRQADKRKNK